MNECSMSNSLKMDCSYSWENRFDKMFANWMLLVVFDEQSLESIRWTEQNVFMISTSSHGNVRYIVKLSTGNTIEQFALLNALIPFIGWNKKKNQITRNEINKQRSEQMMVQTTNSITISNEIELGKSAYNRIPSKWPYFLRLPPR